MEHTQTPAEVQAVIIGKMEAAKVDGANTWQLFKHIQIPATMAVAIMVMILVIYVVQNKIIHGLILKEGRK